MNRFPTGWPISPDTVATILERDLAHGTPGTRELAARGLRALGRTPTAGAPRSAEVRALPSRPARTVDEHLRKAA